MIAKREEFAKALNAQSKQILICGGTGCVAGGSLKIYNRLKEMMDERGIKCTLVLDVHDHDHDVGAVGLQVFNQPGFGGNGGRVSLQLGSNQIAYGFKIHGKTSLFLHHL